MTSAHDEPHHATAAAGGPEPAHRRNWSRSTKVNSLVLLDGESVEGQSAVDRAALRLVGLPRVTETQKLQDQAAAVHDQAIRDAKAAGHPMTQIAAALGITNRVRLYGVLDKTYDNPTAPTPTPVVFLRGAGAPKTVWDDIETAMHRRGLMVVKDRQQAWHLARGGVSVVIVDFSRGSDVTVGRVKARWKDVYRQRTIGQILPKQERERLSAQGPAWLTTPVTIEDREADLPLADPSPGRSSCRRSRSDCWCCPVC